MHHILTAGAQRALIQAERIASGSAESDPTLAPLLAALAPEESRAAEIMRTHQIDLAQILQEFQLPLSQDPATSLFDSPVQPLEMSQALQQYPAFREVLNHAM
ncbi:unnamed protein product, partial [Scytosiphon promiscuus]